MTYFIALDGEAFDNKYSLIQSSEGYELYNERGLSTIECLDWLYKLYSKHRKHKPIFIGFGIRYDIEMIVRDMPDQAKSALFDGLEVRWKGYKLRWFNKKFFSLHKIDKKKSSHGIVWYDTFTFFNCNFIAACKKFLGSVPDEIVSGKANRAVFSLEDLETVKNYNLLECRLLVEMMKNISDMAEKLGVTLNKWHGPSAVASYFLKTWNVLKQFPPYHFVKGESYNEFDDRKANPYLPTGLWEAWYCGYFGGRIEALKLGKFKDVHLYDIRSAYPFAMTKLSGLSYNGWKRSVEYNVEPMSIWHVEFDIPESIGHFPFRENSYITFPRRGIGWYWQPEVKRLFFSPIGKYIKIKEGWYHPFTSINFAEKIEEIYKLRSELKKAGRPEEYILKIGLNSIYGKFAQKVGRAMYRCLPWAGYITSYTRSMLMDAIRGHEDSIISFATDSILSAERIPFLDDQIGENLGQWDYAHYDRATVLMPGVYELEGREEKQTSRGYKKLVFSDVINQLNQYGEAYIVEKYFIGWKLFNAQSKFYAGKYLTFLEDKPDETNQKILNPGNLKKRDYLMMSKKKSRCGEIIKSLKDWNTDNCNSAIIKGSLTESEPIEQAKDNEDYVWLEEE